MDIYKSSIRAENLVLEKKYKKAAKIYAKLAKYKANDPYPVAKYGYCVLMSSNYKKYLKSLEINLEKYKKYIECIKKLKEQNIDYHENFLLNMRLEMDALGVASLNVQIYAIEHAFPQRCNVKEYEYFNKCVNLILVTESTIWETWDKLYRGRLISDLKNGSRELYERLEENQKIVNHDFDKCYPGYPKNIPNNLLEVARELAHSELQFSKDMMIYGALESYLIMTKMI